MLTGTLRPRAQVQVVAEVQARLLRVLRDEGARVAKGEVLAVLDDTDYRLANDRARAALAVAEANRAHALAEKERADNLLKTGGITDKDHLSAQVALQVAEASLAQARAEVAIAAPAARAHAGQGALRGPRREAPAPTRAPCSPAGTPLFTLVDDSVLEFRAPVAVARLRARCRLGAAVERHRRRAAGRPRRRARVARVAPLVDERTRSFEVVVEVPGPAPSSWAASSPARSVRVGTGARARSWSRPPALVRDGSDPRAARGLRGAPAARPSGRR